jgi:hypothetical protein
MDEALSVAAFAKSRLAALVPLAIEKLAEAMSNGESWAIKLVLDAAGLERIASQVLEGDAAEKADPVISTPFERELVERVLRAFCGDIREQEPPGSDRG